MLNNENQNLTSARKGGIAFTLLMGVYLFLSLVLQVLIGLVFPQDSVWYYVLVGLIPAISVVVVIGYFYNGSFSHVKTDFLLCHADYKSWLIVLPLFLGMFFGLGFLNGIIGEGIEALGGTLPEIILPLNDFGEYLLLCVSYAIIPAIFEELFFRGLLLFSLKKVGKVCAIISTALCFALYHCSVIQFAYQFIYGVILATLVYKAKSIIPSMVLHFLNNFIVLTLEFFGVVINLYSLWFIIPGLLLLGLGAVAMIALKNKLQEKKSAKIKDFWLPYALFGSIVCVGFAVLTVVIL